MHTTVDVPGPRAALVNQNIRVPPRIRRRGRGHLNQNIRVPPRIRRRGREHPHHDARIPPRARQPASWGAEVLCVLLKVVLRALLSSRLLWRPFRKVRKPLLRYYTTARGTSRPGPEVLCGVLQRRFLFTRQGPKPLARQRFSVCCSKLSSVPCSLRGFCGVRSEAGRKLAPKTTPQRLCDFRHDLCRPALQSLPQDQSVSSPPGKHATAFL